MWRIRGWSEDWTYIEIELLPGEVAQFFDLIWQFLIYATQAPIYDDFGWIGRYRVGLLLDRPLYEITLLDGICEECEYRQAERFIIINDHWLTIVCESCGYCYFCGRIIGLEEAVEVEVNGRYVLAHRDCLPTCSACGQTSSSYVEDSSGHWLCEECAYWCPYCETYHTRAEFCLECDRCVNCCTCSDLSSELYDYSYKPSPVFFHLDDERPGFYIGLELEAEAPDQETYDLMVSKIHANHEELYCKSDGSLGSFGFEIVSHPLTYAYATKVLTLRKLLEMLRENSCTSYSNKRCGFHVHISRDFFKSGKELAKLGLLVSKLMKLKAFKSFIQRTEGQISNWCKPHDIEACIKSIKEGRILYDLSSTRYRCVNYQNDATIEFRIFRGTLKTERILAYLQFVISCAYLVKQVSAAYFINHSSKDLFLLVLDYAKRNNYKELCYYLIRGVKKHKWVVRNDEIIGEEISSPIIEEIIEEAPQA